MKKIIIILLLQLILPAPTPNTLELLVKLDIGLPPSGRNGSYLGKSLSNVGDVNHDGYDDWAIGLPDAAVYETGERKGKVYIYFGGNPVDVNPDAIFTSQGVNFNFGMSISSAGDLNNDGYNDVIVGTKNYAYIYLGSTHMDSNPDMILIGESERDYFGFCVSGAGDVNQDGFSDVVVGAHGYYLDGYDAGRAYIYFGGRNMDSTADVILTGEAAGDCFGENVSGTGDVNNDGYDDVIVSAPRNDSKGEHFGRVYIYYGGDSMDAHADVINDGSAFYPYWGSIMSPAGDVNCDGYDDIIVGTSERVCLLYGNHQMDADAGVVLAEKPIGIASISCVSSAGDINNDGYADVIIGAPMNDAGGLDAGCAYLYYGGKTMKGQGDVIFTGNEAYRHFGHSVSYAGDVNKDGFADVIIGGSGTNHAYIYLGGNTMDAVADIILAGEGELGSFGECVSYAGDVNRDGYADVIVGSHCDDSNGLHAGRAFIYLGGNPMDDHADVVFTGEGEFNYFGSSVSYAGDVNRDGYDDVIVGAPGNDAGGEKAGRVYIYQGGRFMNSHADVIITGRSPGQRIGSCLSNAGDMNKDGYDDIVIGAPFFNASGMGTSYVHIYYGGRYMDANVDIVIAKKNWMRFGVGVSNAGDVNNDGYADILVGDGSNVYIYNGCFKMDTIPDFIIYGEAKWSEFGRTLSCAEDVNNDGITDILVGAPNHCATGYSMGRVYIYKGIDHNPNVVKISPNGFMLYQNFPNPFNSETSISYYVPRTDFVTLNIYNLNGKEMAILINRKHEPGEYTVKLNSNGFPSGLYFYRLSTGKYNITKKLVVQK